MNKNYLLDELKVAPLDFIEEILKIELKGLSVYSYIKLDTINYRNFIKNKEYKINAMARKKLEQTKKIDYKKAFKKLDRDELIIIIESLKERIVQLEQEKDKQQKIK